MRTLLEDRFGKESVYNMGLKVYTTADVELHQEAQKAIEAGIDGLVQRNGYRGPLRHLAGKELAAYQSRQVKYYNKYPPRKGLSVTALVASSDKKRQGLNLHLGGLWAVLPERARRQGSPHRRPAARGRGAGAPAEPGPPQQDLDRGTHFRPHGAGGAVFHGVEDRQGPGAHRRQGLRG